MLNGRGTGFQVLKPFDLAFGHLLVGDGEELAEAIREADRLIQIARDEEYARREAHPKTKPDPATEIHRSVIGAAETLWISKPIAGRRMISVSSSAPATA